MAESWEPEVLLFTDGACSGNPGPGGWAFILKHPRSGRALESSGAQQETTNNRMELQAVIEGLSTLKRRSRVQIVTDSAYVMNGVTQWMPGWKAHGWTRKTSGGRKPVKNLDLWKKLDALLSRHDHRFQHVRGHDGHPENERCDQLAVEAYRKLQQAG